MLNVNRIHQFLPLQKVNIGPSRNNLLLLGKRLDDMEFEHAIKQLIHDLIDLFIGETHGLKVDLVVEKYLCLGYLLVALGKDVVGALKQVVVQNFYCLGLVGVVAGLRGCEELRTDAILAGIQLQIGEELLKHLSSGMTSEIFGWSCMHSKRNLNDDLLKSLKI